MVKINFPILSICIFHISGIQTRKLLFRLPKNEFQSINSYSNLFRNLPLLVFYYCENRPVNSYSGRARMKFNPSTAIFICLEIRPCSIFYYCENRPVNSYLGRARMNFSPSTLILFICLAICRGPIIKYCCK